MTTLLDEAVQAVRRLAPEAQDAIANVLQTLVEDADGQDDVPLDHRPAIEEGLAQLDRGEFVEGTPTNLIASAFRRADR